MKCDTYPISCQLDRIADSLTQYDWDNFAGTIVATVLGAAVALFGSWWLDQKRERIENRRIKAAADDYATRRLDDALSTMIVELGDRMATLEIVSPDEQAPMLRLSKLKATANLARMMARDTDASNTSSGNDAAATKQLQYALDRIGDLSEPEQQRRQLEIIGQIIRAWREGSHDARRAEERFAGLLAKNAELPTD